jgi:hypothetical protein
MASSAINEYLAAHGNGEVSKWLKSFTKPHSDTCRPLQTFESILSKPPIKPPAPFDGSQPFTHYFISSSHNTYLLANQLWGAASPKAYTSGMS